MSENKTYILKKDLPDAKSGSEFMMGHAFDAYYLTSDKTKTGFNCYCYPKNFVESNSEWFKLKEEVNHTIAEADEYSTYFRFWISDPIKKIEVSKERLAEILIAEAKNKLIIEGFSNVGLFVPSEKHYTEKEYIQAIEDSFKAAREPYFAQIMASPYRYKYNTFSDFMNKP